MTAVDDSTPLPAGEGVQTSEGAVIEPSRAVKWLVRVLGFSSALRIAPGWVLPERGLAVAGAGPGWVRLRHAGEQSGARHQCIARQATLLSLPLRFGLAAPILAEKQCFAWGDPACEYVLHCCTAPRWALVAVAPIAALACAIAGLAGPLPLAALGIGGASIAYVVERSRSARDSRATAAASSEAFRWLVARASLRLPVPDAAAHDVEHAAQPTIVPATTIQPAGNVLQNEGEYWSIHYGGTVCRLRDRAGLAYLATLLERPHEDIPALTLAAGDAAPDGSAPAVDRGELAAGIPGDLGEVLDPRARTEYRERLEDLSAELDEAEQAHDVGRAERVREEREALVEALGSAFGLGGRARRAGSPAERARVRVTRAIRQTVDRIRAVDADLGDHLTRSLRTGTFCCYAPPTPTSWTVVRGLSVAFAIGQILV
jgi:hypothetical protein